MYKCCDPLKRLLQNQNKNGFSIRKDNDFFYLSFLTVDKNEVDDFAKVITSNNFKSEHKSVKLSGETVIKFCPFCGKKLTQKKSWIDWVR